MEYTLKKFFFFPTDWIFSQNGVSEFHQVIFILLKFKLKDNKKNKTNKNADEF